MKLTQQEILYLESQGFYFSVKQPDEPMTVFGTEVIAKEIDYIQDEKEFIVNGYSIIDNDEIYLLIKKEDLNIINLAFSYFNESNGTQELEFNLGHGVTVFVKNIIPDEEIDENFWESESNLKYYVDIALYDNEYDIYL